MTNRSICFEDLKELMYFGPADMVGQVAGVQNSMRVPYRMFTWLKKSTAGDGGHQKLVLQVKTPTFLKNEFYWLKIKYQEDINTIKTPARSTKIQLIDNCFIIRKKKGSRMNSLLTASHSLRSSPTGRRTTSRRLQLPRVASMCLFSFMLCVRTVQIWWSDW